jgi:hypothetical protein
MLSVFLVAQEQSAIEIATDQMMKWPSIDQEKQKDFASSEKHITQIT